MKKNNQSLDLEKQYYEKYTEEEFDKLIKQVYEIKGEVTHLKILNAKKKNKVKFVLSEYEEQKLFVKWLRDNKIKCQSSGNGFALDTKNNIRYMAKLKATGLSVGFPDLEILIGNGITLYVEMKRTKGGVVSEAQKKWIEWLNENGYNAKVCYGAEEAIEFVKNCINNLKKLI
ncbi:MAG: VRR-NUC domain-containing protein [Bacteroidales bacterium]|nr:VRR-NUC domain-containing protein [Bacteroidales bacterium]